MPGGDHCAVWGCDNDRRYPENQIVLPHVGILRFYSPLTKGDITSWGKAIRRDKFKVTFSTKVCGNHFKAGYRHSDCRTPTMYMKGYDTKEWKTTRAPPKERMVVTTTRKRKKMQVQASDVLDEDNQYPKKRICAHDTDSSENQASVIIDSAQTTETKISLEAEKRRNFIEQATCAKNCYRYTGLSRPKVDLVFSFIEEKANTINYWRGCKDTIKPSGTRTKKKKALTNQKRTLTKWEEFVLTLVRIRKGFDVFFLADTFGISAGQITRVCNTWIIFLSHELSFLVPWPSRHQISSNLPKRFEKFPNVRIIIDCLELYLQKPKLPASQKMTWSSYKH